MKNEHAGSECPSCAAWVAQLQAVEDALREVGAPITIPGQEGTLLPPDRIRQMAVDHRTSLHAVADEARSRGAFRDSVRTCLNEAGVPTGDGGFPHSLERRLSMLVQERDRLRGVGGARGG